MKLAYGPALSLALFIGALTTPLAAQTVDPVNYFMLQPGLWRIEEDRAPGQPSNYRFATVVTQLGKFTLHNEFEWNGSSWVPDDVSVFEITPAALLFHGYQNPITQDFEVFNPPIRIPRAMQIGTAVVQNLTVITPQGSLKVAVTALVSAIGITKQVKAGTFTNCARFQFSFMADQYTDQSIEIRSPQSGTIWSLNSELDATEPELSMGSVDITERVQ